MMADEVVSPDDVVRVQTGRRRVNAVLITILIAFSLVIGFLLTMEILNHVYEGERAFRVRYTCSGTLRQIGNALLLYATDYEGMYPVGNGADVMNLLIQERYLRISRRPCKCPSTSRRGLQEGVLLVDHEFDYVYFGGGRPAGHDQPLLWDKEGNHPEGCVHVLFPGNIVQVQTMPLPTPEEGTRQ